MFDYLTALSQLLNLETLYGSFTVAMQKVGLPDCYLFNLEYC